MQVSLTSWAPCELEKSGRRGEGQAGEWAVAAVTVQRALGSGPGGQAGCASVVCPMSDSVVSHSAPRGPC